MPDKRKHRGPHSTDSQLFATDCVPILRQAVEHLSWLLTRSYTLDASLKLVGDHFQLRQRQRTAVARSSCSDDGLEQRIASQVTPDHLIGKDVEIDGFNLLTTIEAALAGGVILIGRDGAYRDMASMHGNYRKVEETRPALTMIGQTLQALRVDRASWLFDKPVSNSGRIVAIVRDVAEEFGWNWTAELSLDPDVDLVSSNAVVVSADSEVISNCRAWFNLAEQVVRRCVPEASIVDLGSEPAT